MCSGLTTFEMPAPPLPCFPENCVKRFLTQNSLRQSLDITNFLGEYASQTPLVAACFRTLSFRVRRYYHLNLAKILTALIKDAAIDRSAVTWITHTLVNKYSWAIAFGPVFLCYLRWGGIKLCHTRIGCNEQHRHCR